ncbi:hypothetical protein NC652_015053 [Populus alba x Populus x berolinensis]|nr:hypothetical protein NC652_014403 [Populus alba x Populus x berolinensis]KAJ6931750.1 hypothetical protein NC652_015053 [Populus alba x Populus x berolinensis]
MPCGLLLLQAPVLWFSGLPGPPDDSLRVPRDGGLLTPVDPPFGGSLDVADDGSVWRPLLPQSTAIYPGPICSLIQMVLSKENKEQHKTISVGGKLKLKFCNVTHLISYSSSRCGLLAKSYVRYGTIC